MAMRIMKPRCLHEAASSIIYGISTEEVEIHPTSDAAPLIEGRLWDDLDIPALELITRAVHGFRRELPH
jgi:hypothetical protein